MACIRFGAILAISSVAAVDVSAQVVKLTHIGGALEAGVEISHQETQSETSETRTFDRFRFGESIELDVDGYVLSTQLLNFHLGGSFGLRQELLEGSNSSGDTNSMLFGYDTSVNLFPSKPISLLLFALRRLDVNALMARVSRALGVEIRAVPLPFAEAAIDVDRPADLALVNGILSARSGDSASPPAP